MSFQKFHNWGALNRDNIISLFFNNPNFPQEGQTVFDKTQENNMAYIEGVGGAKGIVKSGEMFTTQGASTIFQFSWVSPRTGSQDGKVKQGLNSMDTGDGDTQTISNGESCVGFSYNNPASGSDLVSIQFAGVCECRIVTSGSYTQGALLVPSTTAGRATMSSETSASDSFGIQLNDYNIASGYILAKVNATEKF